MNNSPALTVLLLLGFALLTPIVCFFKRKAAFYMAFLGIFLSLLVSVYNVYRVLHEGTIHYYQGGWAPPIGIEYVLDPLSAFVILVINFIALNVLLHSFRLLPAELPQKETAYYALVLLMFTGINGMVITGDFFNLYVFLEIGALAGYGLLSVGGKKSAVSGLRYLIIGTVGAGFYLLGLGLVFTKTGSLNMENISRIFGHFPDSRAIIAGVVLMVAGFVIKMALFPMHYWLPDAYTYAASSSSAFIAPTGTKIAAYTIIRIVFYVFGVEFCASGIGLTGVVGWLSAIAILYGSIMAMAQRELKRMLAYSSVAQVGYIGLGIGLANPYGLLGAILHVLNHGLMKGMLFMVAGNLRYRLNHSRIDYLDSSLRKSMPWTMAAFTAGALSMVGLPPFAGFFSKLYLVMGTVQRQNWIFLVIILVSSLLNAVYFFRVLENAYLKSSPESKKTDDQVKEAPVSMLLPTISFAGLLIIVGLANGFIVNGLLQLIVRYVFKS